MSKQSARNDPFTVFLLVMVGATALFAILFPLGYNLGWQYPAVILGFLAVASGAGGIAAWAAKRSNASADAAQTQSIR